MYYDIFFYLFRMVIFHKVKYILQLNYLSEREYDRKGGGGRLIELNVVNKTENRESKE